MLSPGEEKHIAQNLACLSVFPFVKYVSRQSLSNCYRGTVSLLNMRMYLLVLTLSLSVLLMSYLLAGVTVAMTARSSVMFPTCLPHFTCACVEPASLVCARICIHLISSKCVAAVGEWVGWTLSPLLLHTALFFGLSQVMIKENTKCVSGML